MPPSTNARGGQTAESLYEKLTLAPNLPASGDQGCS